MQEEGQIRVRYLQVSIPVQRVIDSLRFLKKHTKVSSFQNAVTLIHFKDLSKSEQEIVSLLITIWRAWKDGEVEPPFDLEKAYSDEIQL